MAAGQPSAGSFTALAHHTQSIECRAACPNRKCIRSPCGAAATGHNLHGVWCGHRSRFFAACRSWSGSGSAPHALLVREAFVREFRNRRAVGGYVGLGGTPFSSGGSEREQGIGKDGNRRLRAAMVELAWMWLRWQPDSALSNWFRARVGQTGGRLKKIMIVALARKLLVALWRYVPLLSAETGPAFENLQGRKPRVGRVSPPLRPMGI